MRYRLIEAEALLYLLRPKEATAALPDTIPDGKAFDALRSRQAYLEGYVEVLEKRPTALETLAKASDSAMSQGFLDVALDAATLRGQRLLQQGRFEHGEQVLADALGKANDTVSYQRGSILVNLGMSRLVRNRFDEALTYFERVLADTLLEPTLVHRIALQNAGTCHARLGNLERAIALQQLAVKGHERAGLPQYVQLALGELGASYILSGALRESVVPLLRALEIARENNFPDSPVWAGNLAIAYGDLANWDEAERFNNIAVEMKKAAGSTRFTYNIYNRARIAAGRGHNEEAIAAFEEAIRGAADDPYAAWMAQAGLARVHRQAGRMPDAIKYYEEALITIERTRAELISREYRLTFLSRLIRFHQDYVDALMDNGDVERALEVAESSRARVLAERQGAAQAGRVPASAFVKLAARTRSTLLSYWLAPARSFVWVITGDDIRVVTLPPRDEIAALVRGYRDFVTVSLADPLASSSSPGHKLAETLLSPLAPTLSSLHLRPPGYGGQVGGESGPRPTSPAPATEVRLKADPTHGSVNVVIVADDVLHGLSFDMLPIASPEPHYWIEDVTVTMAPSLALAAEAPTPRAVEADNAGADRALLLVGDPTHTDQELPPLTFAGAELSGITRAFGGTIDTLRGAAATPSAVAAQRLERYGLIHFAAHATASAESPLDSAILLSPELDLGAPKGAPYTSTDAELGPQGASRRYKLYARDVVNLPLSADVVTLSACRSAGGRAYGGEGLVGFAWAFLRAGARQVVAGLWDVDDQSTALLMERFYARLGAGAPPAAALRDAKLSLLQSSGNFRKPYYWAAFAVFSASPHSD